MAEPRSILTHAYIRTNSVEDYWTTVFCEEGKGEVIAIRGVEMKGNKVVRTILLVFFFQAEDGIRDLTVTGVQTCALPICGRREVETHVGALLSLFGSDEHTVTDHDQALGGLVRHGLQYTPSRLLGGLAQDRKSVV